VRYRIVIWLAFGAVVAGLIGRAHGRVAVDANIVEPAAAAAPAPVRATTRAVQARLADLGFLAPDGVDGQPGPRTASALVAFQKWEGLARDGAAGTRTRTALATATRPVPITAGAGRRFEVLLDRQLVLAIDGDRVVRAIPVSTGAPATPTPTGRFRIAAKVDRWWSKPFGEWLPQAMPFTGGVAMHASADVPAQAASHGCVRMTPADAEWAYAFASVGDRVTVVAHSTKTLR
jgi:lipoprotein-anchoring transpeptidase ErfK/SrfK